MSFISRVIAGLTVAGVAVIGCSAAQAGGSLKDAPDAPPPFSWTGTYLGIHLGQSWERTTVTPANPAATPFSVKSDGTSGGVFAGYNYQMKGVVLGIEGDISGLSMTGDTISVVGGSTTRTVVEADWAGRVRGRIGLPMDRTMFFVAGGWSTMNTSVNAVSLSTPGQSSKITQRLNGYNIGAGVEHAATNNVLVRLEYIYDRYNGSNYETGANPFFVDRATDKFNVNTVRA